MANDLLEYRGYHGSVEFSAEDEIFSGKVLFIDSLLMYHGTTVEEIKKGFQEAVDAYLEFCKETGKEPNKPHTGSFNVRTGPELHRAAVIAAKKADVTLNEFVKAAIQEKVNNENSPATKEKPAEKTYSRDFMVVESFSASTRVATKAGATMRIEESREARVVAEEATTPGKPTELQFPLH